MSAHRASYPIATMCRVLGVSPSGYHAWTKRPPSRRATRDGTLTESIRAAHAASHGTYGAPRIQVDLATAGVCVSRKRIARLMRHAGIAGVSRRKFAVTTRRDGGRQAPDLVARNFMAERPDQLWVADITYVPTWAGFLYLAVVLDACSRRIVGWSMAPSPCHATGARCPRHGAHDPSTEGRDPSFRPRLAGRIQVVVATRCVFAHSISLSSASAGVFQSSVLRGLWLRAAATAAISSALCMLRSVPFGKYWRKSPLVFSLVARCHGLCGSQK